MNFQDINKKLENVRDLIKGEDYEKNINRLNTVLKYATETWLLIDPITGSVAKGAQLATNVLDDLLSGLKDASQEDINALFNEVLEKHQEEIASLRSLVNKLVPKASVSFKQNGFMILNGHGISSITDYSNHHFSMNFVEQIDASDEYMALCNVTGSQTDISSNSVDVLLPDNWSPDNPVPVKVMVVRIHF